MHAYVNGMTIIFSLGILIPYVLRIGYSTYYDRFGARGVRGFYYSGNDITGALMILLPLAIAYFCSSRAASSPGAACCCTAWARP